jgi:hypothetical protein
VDLKIHGMNHAEDVCAFATARHQAEYFAQVVHTALVARKRVSAQLNRTARGLLDVYNLVTGSIRGGAKNASHNHRGIVLLGAGRRLGPNRG